MMDKQHQRIKAILGKDCTRDHKNVAAYLTFLLKSVKAPCRLMGTESFPWEKPYQAAGWDDPEYMRMKNENPSFTDEFDLIGLLPPEVGSHEIIARITRVSDGKSFELLLSWLECTDFDSENHQLIDEVPANKNMQPGQIRLAK